MQRWLASYIDSLLVLAKHVMWSMILYEAERICSDLYILRRDFPSIQFTLKPELN